MVIALSVHDDEATAIGVINRGAEDYLVRTQISGRVVEDIVAQASLRRWRAHEEFYVPPNVEISDRRSVARERERRRTARYVLTHPVDAIPILPNGAPNEAERAVAMLLDLSKAGVAILVQKTSRLPAHHWVLGVEVEPGAFEYLYVELANTEEMSDGLRLGFKFITPENDLLLSENLTPRLNPNTYRFEYRLRESVIEKWLNLDVIRSHLWSRIKVCPSCSAMVVASLGCQQCGAPHIDTVEMIHHFACAYISFAHEFEKDSDIVCPKCKTRSLVVGADYETLDGPYVCQVCKHKGTEKIDVGNCLQCKTRFPLEKAANFDLYAYDVERLDILALLDAAR